MTLDRNGYSLSLLQSDDLPRCYLCDRTDGKLDRHEIFGASCRKKSKRLGLWVLLCGDCHTGPDGVHRNAVRRQRLKGEGQDAAMRKYGWSKEDFIAEFGKNYLEVDS